jgi:hypothetical protein
MNASMLKPGLRPGTGEVPQRIDEYYDPHPTG